jgi:hypothetical protein
MTLIIATFAPEGVVFTSDMRLSWNGQLRDDERIKLGFYKHFNARLLFGYTGLAEWSTGNDATSFNTFHWLSGELHDASIQNHTLDQAMERLRARFSEVFKTHPILSTIQPSHKALTIHFKGFEHFTVFNRPVSFPVSIVLSNTYDMSGGGRRYSEAQVEFFLSIDRKKIGRSARHLISELKFRPGCSLIFQG